MSRPDNARLMAWIKSLEAQPGAEGVLFLIVALTPDGQGKGDHYLDLVASPGLNVENVLAAAQDASNVAWEKHVEPADTLDAAFRAILRDETEN